MRNVLFGLVVGFMLSALRAPLGIDLTELPAVSAETAYGFRALALGLIAAAWWLQRDGAVSIGFLASAAFAFALHALIFAGLAAPSSAPQLWITGLLGFALLVVIGRGDMMSRPADGDEPSFVQMLGLCAAGAGVAVALESVARHVRLFGSGLAQDDSVSASVLLAFVLLGAIACGWIASTQRLRSLSFPTGLAATATACFLSLHTIGRIGTAQGLTKFLPTYGLDTASHGMLSYDALIAAACFALPALLLGATLRGARSKLEIASALAGAALGLYFVPLLLTTPENRDVGELEIFSAQLVPFGCLTAALGAAVALLGASKRTATARWSAITLTLCSCVAPLLIAVSPKLVISPWMTVPPKQLLVCDGPEGLVTVEPSASGLPMATLDRRALTPPTESAVADAQRIKLAIAMVPADRRQRASTIAGPMPANAVLPSALRVLLIGQNSPVRDRAFKDMGIDRVDRCAPWYRSMKRMDAALFEGQPAPIGDRLSPAEARRRIAAGEYDLVIAEPVTGDAPATCNLSVPADTTLVAWFAAEQWIAARNLGDEVVYWSEGVGDPAVGVVVHGARTPPSGPSAPILVAAGERARAPLPIKRLCMHDSERFTERDNWCRAALAARLADAAKGGTTERLMRGYALLFGAQSNTSSFETNEERLQLPADALDLFEAAATSAPPGDLVRSLWEGLARVLLGKRDVAAMYQYLAPLAQRHAPWPVLEQVLAQADLEALEPQSAARRLRALIAARADAKLDAQSLAGDGTRDIDLAAAREKDLELWYWLGEAERRAGDHASASQSWRRAFELQPQNRALKRELAIELVRADDPDGRTMIGELLAENPSDTGLEIFQGPGPYPDALPTPKPHGKKHADAPQEE
jgi:tetratricopeptide (TPR) repeat protein